MALTHIILKYPIVGRYLFSINNKLKLNLDKLLDKIRPHELPIKTVNMAKSKLKLTPSRIETYYIRPNENEEVIIPHGVHLIVWFIPKINELCLMVYHCNLKSYGYIP